MDQEDLDAAKVDILDRMRECGWITGFAITREVATCQFTPHGRLMIDSLRALFFRDGHRISDAECVAFCNFVLRLEQTQH